MNQRKHSHKVDRWHKFGKHCGDAMWDCFPTMLWAIQAQQY